MNGRTTGAPAEASVASVRTRAVPWYAQGVLSGFLGAGVVAVFFLAIDLLEGRPLHAPDVLGSALFLGELPPPGAPIQPVVVLGYTAIHATFFTAFGVMAAFELLTAQRLPAHPWRAGVLAAVALFLLTETAFVALAALVEPRLLDELGSGRVALANALAAVAMTLYLIAWRKAYGGPAEP